jgi:hypothetical protein
MQLAAQRRNPVAEPQKPSAGGDIGIETLSRIADADGQPIAVARDLHARTGNASVFHHVG